MHRKVTVVGSGNVGATTAHWVASQGLADIVLVDIIEGVPEGKGLDLLEAMPIARKDISVLGTESYADTAKSDIVVITAGVPRKPGMSRDQLLDTNFRIMRDVVWQSGVLFAKLHPDHRLEPPRCNGARCLQDQRLS